MGEHHPASAPTGSYGMVPYRAPSLFQPHHVRKAIRDAYEGKRPRLLGYYMGLSTVPTARVIATLGYDVVWVDWEHSSCGVETMTTMVHEIQFMSEGHTVPWVRVPGHDHAAIGFALDAGASIVIPQVETVEEAKHVCSAAKFGNRANGTRSCNPPPNLFIPQAQKKTTSLTDHFALPLPDPPYRLIPTITDTPSDPSLPFAINLNAQAAIMLQIETLPAVHNLDAILSACRSSIDMVWLGTLDLRVSMDLPGFPLPHCSEPEWLDALQVFRDTCRKYDMPTGGAVLAPPVDEGNQVFIKMGGEHTLCVVSSDVGALVTDGIMKRETAKQVLKPLKNGVIVVDDEEEVKEDVNE